MNANHGGGAFVPPPCPFCNSGTFVHARNVNVEIFIAGARTSATDFNGAALVCTGCGRTELFMSKAQIPEWASSVNAQIVKRPAESPYR